MNENKGLCELENIEPVDVDSYMKLEELLGVLSNKTRIAILSIMLKYESVCACELQPALGLEQPSVTTHLQKLYNSGILERKNVWRYTLYSIKKEHRHFLESILKSHSAELSSASGHSVIQ